MWCGYTFNLPKKANWEKIYVSIVLVICAIDEVCLCDFLSKIKKAKFILSLSKRWIYIVRNYWWENNINIDKYLF